MYQFQKTARTDKSVCGSESGSQKHIIGTPTLLSIFSYMLLAAYMYPY